MAGAQTFFVARIPGIAVDGEGLGNIQVVHKPNSSDRSDSRTMDPSIDCFSNRGPLEVFPGQPERTIPGVYIQLIG